MVDIDDAVRVAVDEFFRQHLHVACKDNEVDVVFFKQFEFLLFLFCLVLFGDGDYLKRDAELLANVGKVGMVAYNQRNFYIPFAGSVACQQVIDAVRHF